jgi:hypothetical protein
MRCHLAFCAICRGCLRPVRRRSKGGAIWAHLSASTAPVGQVGVAPEAHETLGGTPTGAVPSEHVGLGSCSSLDLVVQTLGAVLPGGVLAGGGDLKQIGAFSSVLMAGVAAAGAQHGPLSDTPACLHSAAERAWCGQYLGK